MNLKNRMKRALPVLSDLKALLEVSTRHKPHLCECPCCGYESKFRMYGMPPRLNALCTACGSLERHRLMQLYFDQNPSLVEGATVLHFAPEPMLERRLRARSSQYVGCDFHPKSGQLKINIEAIDIPTATFDIVVCNQVLEHVDDRTALSEMHRVLKPTGAMLLTFPVIEGWSSTYENPEVDIPADRLIHFGQEDHVRYFGADVRSRIRDAGFRLEEFTAVEPLVHKHGLIRGEKVFIGWAG